MIEHDPNARAVQRARSTGLIPSIEGDDGTWFQWLAARRLLLSGGYQAALSLADA